jgi:hypothetical protein
MFPMGLSVDGGGHEDKPLSDRASVRAVDAQRAALLLVQVSELDASVSGIGCLVLARFLVTPQRLTPATLDALRDQLSDRDALILSVLRRVRMATARQIESVCFLDATPLSNARMSRRTLERLRELRVVARLERTPGGVRGGSAGHVFALDTAGIRLTDSNDRPHRGIRRPWTTSLAFVKHHLAVTQLYCDLATRQQSFPGELLDFVTEPAAWRRFTGPYGAPTTLKPDAYLRITVGDFEDRWFVELDENTEGTQQLQRKLAAHGSYWRTGAEDARYGVHPRTIWVVPDKARRDQLVRLLSRLPRETWPLFVVVEAGRAVELLLSGSTNEGGTP